MIPESGTIFDDSSLWCNYHWTILHCSAFTNDLFLIVCPNSVNIGPCKISLRNRSVYGNGWEQRCIAQVYFFKLGAFKLTTLPQLPPACFCTHVALKTNDIAFVQPGLMTVKLAPRLLSGAVLELAGRKRGRYLSRRGHSAMFTKSKWFDLIFQS